MVCRAIDLKCPEKEEEQEYAVIELSSKAKKGKWEGLKPRKAKYMERTIKINFFIPYTFRNKMCVIEVLYTANHHLFVLNNFFVNWTASDLQRFLDFSSKVNSWPWRPNWPSLTISNKLGLEQGLREGPTAEFWSYAKFLFGVSTFCKD